MRSCTYCGKENDDSSGSCTGCGTSLDSPPHALATSVVGLQWPTILALSGCGVGLLGTGFIAILSYPFFFIHHDIRPMSWWMTVVMTAGVTFFIALPCAIVGIVKGRRLLGWLGVVLALAPGPVGVAMLETAMALNGFHMKE